MTRIAGDSSDYTFRLCRVTDLGVIPTDHGFEMPSVTTFIKETLAVPPSAMAWWGYKIAMKGMADALVEDPAGLVDQQTAEELQAFFKERGVSPNMKRDEAGDRGSNAHTVLELLADGESAEAARLAQEELDLNGTRYGHAAIAFWDECVQPYLDSGDILEVRSEVPVWYFGRGPEDQFCGTFDLALRWKEGWEILDAKTHKPAKGFTLDGKGAGYDSDAAQGRAYRMAFEEMGLGKTIGQRTIVLRENGKFLEDDREVSEGFVKMLRSLYEERVAFDAKEEKVG